MTLTEIKYVEKLKEFNRYLLKYSGTSARIERFKSEISILKRKIRRELKWATDHYLDD